MSSKILADFLDPKGAHGQGALFLNAFLKRFISETFSTSPEKAEVKTEARTYAIESCMRRMDICVTFPDAILAIENKLWAKDQPNQVQDYLGHIQFIKKQFHLIYLSPSMQSIPPDSLSSKAEKKFSGHYSLISWEKVLDLLEECSFGACPEKLRAFIKDFNRAVRTALWT